MKQAIKECRSTLPDSIEDFFFTKAAALLGARIPDFPTARRFSVAALASHLHEQLRLFATALGLPA